MELILIRHAKAEERSLTQYPDDDMRPLTKEGKMIQKGVARSLHAMVGQVDKVFTSPLLRAIQTAEITIKAMELQEKPVVTDMLGHSFSPLALTQFLEESTTPEETIILVGHEPDLSELLFFYLGHNLRIRFRKSGVVMLGFAGYAQAGSGELLGFFRPRQLTRLSL